MSLRDLRDCLGRIGSWLVSLILRRPGDWLSSRLTFLGLRPGCVEQSGMLILTDIEPSKEGDLRESLDNIRKWLFKNQDLSFHKTETVHYAAWMILPEVRSDPPIPTRLAFETNYDGDLRDHLQDLVRNCQQELDDVYRHFRDYPPPGSKGPLVEQFLFDRYQQTSSLITASAYHNALWGRSLKDIKNATAVYDEAKCFVDTLDEASDSKAIRSALVEHFKDPWVVEPKRFPITQRGIRGLFAINMAVLLLLCFLPPIVSILGYSWWRGLPVLFAISVAVLMLLCFMPLLYFLRWGVINVVARYFELKEGCENLVDPSDHEAEYAHLDLGRQNHLCTYTTIIPSNFRRYLIRRTLWLGSVLFNYFFILGRLDQIGTIHFGRWTLIGDQLLFYGNYDGSWSNYLTDFSDEAWGVNLVWGNTIGFPQTKFITGRGARDLEGFQAQAAKHYAPAPVFYSAYHNHSLVNLLRYLRFRDELLEEIGA
jgi:hypothetical protein